MLRPILIFFAAMLPPAVLAQDIERTPRIETYKRTATMPLTAHVFAPPGTANSPRAAILLFHGGGWNTGSPESVYASARRFAGLGMVAIAIQYRLSDGKSITPLDAIDDARDAFRWVRNVAMNLNVDPNRVAAYGVSTGGQLAVAAALVLPKVPVVGAVRGGPDAIVLDSPALAVTDDGRFNKLLLKRAKTKDISPDQLVRPGAPPTFISHGDEDSLIPYGGSRNFCRKMKEAGNDCELRTYTGLGHLLTRKLDEQETLFDADPVARADAWHAEQKFLSDRGFTEIKVAAAPDRPEMVVRALLAAFNAHDVDAMAKRVADDFVWFDVTGDKLNVETRGRDALRKGMEGYFKKNPTATSGVHMLSTNGNFVSVRERAAWKTKNGESRAQTAIAVYEVVDGLIKRVWYFPTQQ